MAQVLVDGRTVQVNDCAVEILALRLQLKLQVECGNNIQEKLRIIRRLRGDSPSPASVAALELVRKELEATA